MKPLRSAVVGCGRIGCGFDDDPSTKIIRTHAGSYYNNQNTKLVALCDIDEIKLKKYGKKYQVSGLYTNSSEMFNKEQIDCVSICTLVESHLDLVKEAAKYDVKGIFLEKPISNSISNAKKIIEICKTHNISLIIDHQRRFIPAYHSVKKFIRTGKLGNIELVNVYYGSGIANTGSHLFDMLRLLFDEVTSLKANFSKNKSLNPNDPNVDAIIQFVNNTFCKINALDYRNYGVLEMDIFGTLGRIRLDLSANDIEYFNISSDSLVYKHLVKSILKTKKSSKSPIQLGLINLLHSIKTQKEPLSTGYDGYKSLELIIASLISSKHNKEITLPILKNNYKITST